ncbi:MAG: four helix bundle protein [Endomicrobium sp.]|jgi:hypothetical protein|nr:four helix bundle protein [Endomicrobium sp.]
MYKKLEIWNEALSLIKEVYKIAGGFPKSEEFNLKLQVKRAKDRSFIKKNKCFKEEFVAIRGLCLLRSFLPSYRLIFLCFNKGVLNENFNRYRQYFQKLHKQKPF